MNASLVVSISVLMIGAAIAIYAFLTGNTLADGEQFSLKFSADVTTLGTTAPAEVYFCTGPSCAYYQEYIDKFADGVEVEAPPEFFALVGIDGGDGSKYLTELVGGMIFEFDADGLVSCNAMPEIDAYVAIGEAKDMASSATMSSFDVGTVIDFSGEGNSMTITGHAIDYDPNVSGAEVLGLSIPTPEECAALTFSSRRLEENQAREAKLNEERKLWMQDERNLNAVSTYDLWWAAHGSYDKKEKLDRAASLGGWTLDTTCCGDDNGGYESDHTHDWGCANNEIARFFHKGNTKVLAFAGSDDTHDWIYNNANLFPKFNGAGGAIYHSGFYNYQNSLINCINSVREGGWGAPTYIAGHSLGGAAATVYAQEHGNGARGTATFGAPKTNVMWTGNAVGGWRFVHSNDPVPSNLCFLGCPLKAHQHMVTNVYEVYDYLNTWTTETSSRVSSQVKKCKKKWWKFWCWFETVWTVVYNVVTHSAWEKRMDSGKSQNFAHDYLNIVLGIWGALEKHGAYGDYPSVTA